MKNHSKKQKRQKRRGYTGSFFHGFLLVFRVFLCFAAVCLIAGGVAYLKYQKEIALCYEKSRTIIEDTKVEDFSKPADTHIYDVDGQLIGTINSGHYEYAPYDTISPYMVQAYIAQEDRRFYKHNGIDIMGIMRAGFTYLKKRGTITQGGSTITQQVIKNTYLTQDRTFERKLTEIMTAPDFEKIYSKDQIMEFYCNTNFYANRCYGIKEAARYYFDKEPADLTLWEAATLAGVSNNPSKYDPVKNPQNAVGKRNQVLSSMLECGLITDDEYQVAKRQELTVAKIYEAGTPENYQTSYAIHCAALELMKNEGFAFRYVFDSQEEYDAYKEKYNTAYQEKSTLIRGGGFEIHTSLDSTLQNQLQDTIDEHLIQFTDLQENGKFALQGSAVCVDNKTGYVAAIVGGRGTDDEFNRGFLSKRQPGSTIKPLIDYAPAFESGFYYPSKMVDDHKFDKGPKNSGGRYYGYVSVREALNRSLNTVAWQVLDDIGVDTGIDYLGKLHFASLNYLDNGNISMSIGGFTDGARVVDMAKGYSVLANEGMYSYRTCIIDIISQYDGNVYREQPDESVFTADTAYMITDILKGTLSLPYGTGYGLGLKIPAAGKTGTTNDNKDTWFCGYTKHYTTAVWVGYDTPRAMPGVYGKTYSGKIWQDFMKQCNDGLPAEDWVMPATVSMQPITEDGEKSTTPTGREDLFSSIADAKASGKLAERQQRDLKRSVEKSLSAYEGFGIATVTDAYQVDNIYNDLKEKIGRIADSDTKNGFLKRLNARHEVLLAQREAWAPQMAQYEEEQRRAAAAQDLGSHEQIVASLKAAINDLYNIPYRDDTVQAKLDNAAALLEACAGFEEYDDLARKYNAAVNHINSLQDQPSTVSPGPAPVPAGPGEVTDSEQFEDEDEDENNIGPGGFGPGY